MAATLINAKELCQIYKITRQTLCNWRKRGLEPAAKGDREFLYDVDALNAWLKEMRCRTRQRHVFKKKRQDPYAVAAAPVDSSETIQSILDGLESGAVQPTDAILKGQAHRELQAARKLELQNQAASGRLIDRDEENAKLFNLTRSARDILLAIPDRIAPILAPELPASEVHRLLLEELRRVAEEIAKIQV